MIKEYEEKTGEKIKSDLKMGKYDSSTSSKEGLLPVLEQQTSAIEPETQNGDATFVDIASLETLAMQSKRTFDAQDFLG
jgi:hypothetical protein